MNHPIKTKSLDKVRKNAIKKSTQNEDFQSVVQGTADSLVFTTGSKSTRESRSASPSRKK